MQDVLTHRVNQERGLFYGVAVLKLAALEAKQRIPREMRQQEHPDDQQRQPPEQ